MKLLVVLLVGTFCANINSLPLNEESEPIKIDWSSIKPLHEIPSYRAANPKIRAPVAGDSFDSRIVNGQIASPTDVPYQVNNSRAFNQFIYFSYFSFLS